MVFQESALFQEFFESKMSSLSHFFCSSLAPATSFAPNGAFQAGRRVNSCLTPWFWPQRNLQPHPPATRQPGNQEPLTSTPFGIKQAIASYLYSPKRPSKNFKTSHSTPNSTPSHSGSHDLKLVLKPTKPWRTLEKPRENLQNLLKAS